MNGPAGRHYRAPGPGPPFRAPVPTDMSGLSSDFTDDYLAPILSLGAIKDAARRRWRLLATAALLGMVFGASFHFVLPKKYAAVTDLYLVQPANVNPDTGMANDASLLQTSAVAGRAVSSLHLNESAATFLSSYTGKALSDVVLQIKFNAPTAVAAVSYDNAVANAFLAVRNAQFSSETNLVVSSLEGQVNNLTTEINHLTAQIDALSGPNTGRQEASQIAALVASRGSAYNEETQLQAQEQQSLLAANSVTQASHVLDPPAVVPNAPVKRVAATDGLSGLIAGLAVGLGVVVVGAAITDRPRRRADVAFALGAPVELSLGRYRPSILMRRRLLKKPPPELQMIQRRLLAHLAESPGAGLATVEVEASEVAALGVGLLAFTLASEGKQVLVIDLATSRPMDALLGGKRGRDRNVSVGAGCLTLVVGPADPAQLDQLEVREGMDAVLVLASADPAFGAEHIAPWADQAVVVVTAGKASATRITSTGQMLRHAGIATRSAILVDAGPEDESFGSAPLVDNEPPAAHTNGDWSPREELTGENFHSNGDRLAGAQGDALESWA